jgi:hypothetical protein
MPRLMRMHKTWEKVRRYKAGCVEEKGARDCHADNYIE